MLLQLDNLCCFPGVSPLLKFLTWEILYLANEASTQTVNEFGKNNKFIHSVDLQLMLVQDDINLSPQISKLLIEDI